MTAGYAGSANPGSSLAGFARLKPQVRLAAGTKDLQDLSPLKKALFQKSVG
ncbi:MAG: hypothetical protein Q7O66_18745 [Dehalococcoidia bacterium]|nr:hypothetical protein [Dehalococcoidia bacterium]